MGGVRVLDGPDHAIDWTIDTLPVAASLVADVDGDGDQDILIGADGAESGLYVADSGSRTVRRIPLLSPRAPAVGDVDGDGFPEILVSNWPGAGQLGVVVLAFDGRTLSPEIWQITGFQPHVQTLLTADCNLDGQTELLVGDEAGLHVHDLRSRRRLWSETGLGNRLSLALGDPDGDGLSEVWSTPSLYNPRADLFNLVTRRVETGVRDLYSDYEGGFGRTVAIADVDDDGQAELLVGDKQTFRVLRLYAPETVKVYLPLAMKH